MSIVNPFSLSGNNGIEGLLTRLNYAVAATASNCSAPDFVGTADQTLKQALKPATVDSVGILYS